MKTSFFSTPDSGRLRKALILILFSLVMISIAIPVMIFSIGSTLFDLIYFVGFVLLFYALLFPWQKSSYHAISITILVGLPILTINLNIGDDFLVKMERAGKLTVHGLNILHGQLEVFSQQSLLQESSSLFDN